MALPPDARDALQKAARLLSGLGPEGESLAERVKAMAADTDHARHQMRRQKRLWNYLVDRIREAGDVGGPDAVRLDNRWNDSPHAFGVNFGDYAFTVHIRPGLAAALEEAEPRTRDDGSPSDAPPVPRETAQAETMRDADPAKPILKQLPPSMAQRMRQIAKHRDYKAGINILRQGEPGDAVYFVQQGEVLVEKEMQDGSTVELARLGPGECFGEMSLLSGDPCYATVRTATPCEFMVLSGKDFDQVMAGNPALHRWFSRLFAERLKATNVRLEEHLVRGMTGRLSMINLMEIVQTLHHSRQTGMLVLNRAGTRGRLGLREGRLFAAVLDDLEGEAAFLELMRWTEGSFSFLKDAGGDLPDNIEVDTMRLLMDAARQVDETSR